MLCRNCGKSIVDTARFCAFCGIQQQLEPQPQRTSGETAGHVPTLQAAIEASDVTVILPRLRAGAAAGQAAQRDDRPPTPSPAAPAASDRPPTRQLSVRAMTIGAAAAVLIIAILASAAFFANRPATRSETVTAAPAGVPESSGAGASSATQSDAPDRASTSGEAPVVAPPEAPIAVEQAPAASVPGSTEAMPPSDATSAPTVAPPTKAAPRKKERAVANPAPEPAPPSPPPQAVEATPAPAPAAPAPAVVEAVKVDKVACADSSNLFSREACLWQECAKPEFHSHAECARFTGPR